VLWEHRVAGSNPVIPIKHKLKKANSKD
jgi:hypothetical protein